ncbi:MAG: RNA polymerase sigma factor, partial [Bacteroidota bacterium]
ARETDFLSMIQQHQGILHKVCRIYTRSETDFSDLRQEVLLQLWRAYPSFRQEAKISTWIYRIALNTAITNLRKAQKQKVQHEDPATLPELPEDSFVPEKIDQHAFLYRAINQLSDIEKAIIILYLEEQSYDEIAQIMGITRNHVGVKISRIKQKLKSLLKPHM